MSIDTNALRESPWLADVNVLCDKLDEARRIATVASALHRDAEQDARNAIRERDAAHREVADRTAERDAARLAHELVWDVAEWECQPCWERGTSDTCPMLAAVRLALRGAPYPYGGAE
jgi:hypothetical protein